MVVIMVLSVAVSLRRKNIKKKRALRRFLETEVRREAGDGTRLVAVAPENYDCQLRTLKYEAVS